MRVLSLAFILQARRLIMNRALFAGLLAVAVFLATTFTAGAADPKLTRQFETHRTYQLACSIGSDGESLQVRMNVRNTSGRVIPKGTQIQLVARSPFAMPAQSVEAYRDVLPNQTIPLSKPPARAIACKASVKLSSALMERIKKSPR
jgi:hypothetical protein